jgi:hypothetical protein
MNNEQQEFCIQIIGWRSVSYSCTSCETYFMILLTGKEREIVCVFVLTHVHVYLCLLQQSYLYYVTSSFSPFFSTEYASYDDKAGTAATL